MSRFGQFHVLKREREKKRDEEIVKKMLKTCQESKAIKKCPVCLCTGFFFFNSDFGLGDLSIHLFYSPTSSPLGIVWVPESRTCCHGAKLVSLSGQSLSHVQNKGTNNHLDSLDLLVRLMCKSLDSVLGENPPCRDRERPWMTSFNSKVFALCTELRSRSTTVLHSPHLH